MTVEDHSIISEEVRNVLRERYGYDPSTAWPEETDHSLIDRIKKEAQKLGKPILNQIPSQFDHEDPERIEAIPQYQFPAWKTLSENFEFFGIKGGAMWLQPAAWQFAWSFHSICRRHRLFAAYGDTYNVPVAVEVARQAKITCLVTNGKSAKDFNQELETSGTIDSLSLAIVAKDVRDPAPVSVSIKGATTLYEIQIFPGHTIAYQSFALAGAGNAFHLSRDYMWRFEETAAYITGLSPAVLPVFNYRLPVRISPIDAKSTLPAFAFHYA